MGAQNKSTLHFNEEQKHRSIKILYSFLRFFFLFIRQHIAVIEKGAWDWVTELTSRLLTVVLKPFIFFYLFIFIAALATHSLLNKNKMINFFSSSSFYCVSSFALSPNSKLVFLSVINDFKISIHWVPSRDVKLEKNKTSSAHRIINVFRQIYTIDTNSKQRFSIGLIYCSACFKSLFQFRQ